MNLEKALRSTKAFEKNKSEVSRDVEAQKKGAQEEIERKKLIDEANRIVNEGATYTNQDKADLRKSEHKRTRRTPSGRITPRGHRSVTRGTIIA
jgi:hypothetical protein